MIPCNSEFRAYALVRQIYNYIKSVWRVRKHETQSYREVTVILNCISF